jgi:hypothetical protein
MTVSVAHLMQYLSWFSLLNIMLRDCSVQLIPDEISSCAWLIYNAVGNTAHFKCHFNFHTFFLLYVVTQLHSIL